MSDTDRPALTTSAHMYLHFCEETDCNEWGSRATAHRRPRQPAGGALSTFPTRVMNRNRC